jgi:hypothetical protein
MTGLVPRKRVDMTKCPMCRRKAQALHTNAPVRALAQELKWEESGVCIDCYDLLAAYRVLAVATPLATKVKPKGKRVAKTADLRARLDAQRRWVTEHGGDLQGYVERYGSGDDATHYGDGGEAIYAADIAALRRLEELCQ